MGMLRHSVTIIRAVIAVLLEACVDLADSDAESLVSYRFENHRTPRFAGATLSRKPPAGGLLELSPS